jgi:hypothetical protein
MAVLPGLNNHHCGMHAISYGLALRDINDHAAGGHPSK